MSPAPHTIETKLIGYYKNRSSKEGADITIQAFLDYIALGEWKTHAEWVREAVDNKEEYDKRKSTSPCVTIGGTFTGDKLADNLREPSGLLAIDLDHLNERTEAVKNQLNQDPYVLVAFKSIGGKGLCVIFRIDPSRFKDAFDGLSEYLITTYGLVGKQFDASSSNINRLRYVSYDNEIDPNFKCKHFAKYPKKAKKEVKKTSFIHTENDLQYIIDQINARSIDIAPGYNEWFKVGWSLISKYGESARDLFQQVSQYNDTYDADEVDKKFRYLVATQPKQITIATFYYHCKLAGLDVMTPQTKEVVSVGAMSKRNKCSLESAIDTVVKMTDADEATARPIIEQVYASVEQFDTQETLFDQSELLLKTNYSLYYNEVRRVFEDENSKSIEDADLFKMYIHARKVLGDKLKYQDFFMLIHSHIVFPKVHPIKDFFKRNATRKPVGVIDTLINSIDTDTGFTGTTFSPSFAGRYIRKWLVGMIGTVYGDPCALVLIFTGAPNAGKTSWFRQLLPAELESYRYESTWSDNRDEQARMCTNILSLNDEFDGKDKARMEHFRGLTTKDYFTIREPYGKKDVRLPRLAVMCGTSNPKNVIDQPEHNRRIIPINVIKVQWDIYNAIDRTDLLMEAYHAYMSGERSDLTSDDIAELRDMTDEFQNKSIEQQLVDQYLSMPTGEGGETIQHLSTTEILSKLELRVNNRKLSLNQLGAALQAAGFVRKSKKNVANGTKLYTVILLE